MEKMKQHETGIKKEAYKKVPTKYKEPNTNQYWWKIGVPPIKESISVLNDDGTLAATRTFLRYVARVSAEGEEDKEGWVCSEVDKKGKGTPQLDEVNKDGTTKS